MSGAIAMKRPLPPPDNFDVDFDRQQRVKMQFYTEAHRASIALAKRLELEEAVSAKKRDVDNYNTCTMAQQEASNAVLLEGFRKEAQEDAEKKKELDEAATALSMELIAKENQVRHSSDQVLLLTRSFQVEAEKKEAHKKLDEAATALSLEFIRSPTPKKTNCQ